MSLINNKSDYLKVVLYLFGNFNFLSYIFSFLRITSSKSSPIQSKKFSELISPITPSVSITISSSNNLFLFDYKKYSSPHIYPFVATTIPDLFFLTNPSTITNNFY